MIYKSYKDIRLSTLGMGNLRLPLLAGDSNKNAIDYPEAHKIIDLAYERGINYFDTAYGYNNGDSEKCLGECMKKHPRDSFYIATKFHIGVNPDYKAVFEEQLKRLQTDHIDFYLIHSLMDSNYQSYIDSGAIEYFLQKKKEGKITYLGFSSHSSLQTLEKFADHHDWDFVQIQLNYFDWYFGGAKKEYEAMHKRSIPIVIMEPVRGGRLADLTPDANKILKDAHPDWSIASWALRFVKSLPGIQVVLSGMSNLEQTNDNLETFSDSTEFTEEDWDTLKKAADLFHSQLQVPCTSCRYCTDGCPVEINIPEFLKVYNNYKVNGNWALDAAKNVDSVGKPSDCVSCGACTGHCPQSIKIPDIMGELANLLK